MVSLVDQTTKYMLFVETLSQIVLKTKRKKIENLRNKLIIFRKIVEYNENLCVVCWDTYTT